MLSLGTVAEMPTYLTEPREHLSCIIAVQPLERFELHMPLLESEEAAAVEVPESLIVFAVEDPVKIEITSLATLANRGSVLEWEICRSDTDAPLKCVSLHKPKAVSSDKPLDSRSIPVVNLLDELEKRHFAGVSRRVCHCKVSEIQEFDNRSLWNKRFYLQCVLQQQALFEAGACDFHSELSFSFYQLLLKKPAIARTDLRPAQCQSLLSGKICGASSGSASIMRKSSTPAVTRPENAILSDSGSESVSEDENKTPPAKKPKTKPKAKPELLAHLSSMSESEGLSGLDDGKLEEDLDDEKILDGELESVIDTPAFVEGQAVSQFHDKWGINIQGLRVACNNPAHKGCNKSRNLGIDADIDCHMGAALYLGAWLSKSRHLSQESHKKYFPTPDEVRMYAASGASFVF